MVYGTMFWFYNVLIINLIIIVYKYMFRIILNYIFQQIYSDKYRTSK